MSGMVERFLVCDGKNGVISPKCCQTYGTDHLQDSLQTHRENARKAKWICTSKGEDSCPECLKYYPTHRRSPKGTWNGRGDRNR